MADLLRRAVHEAGLPDDRIHTVLDEVDSVLSAVELADPGDLVVALVDRVPVVWDALQKRSTRTSAAPSLNGNGVAHGEPSVVMHARDVTGKPQWHTV